MKWQRKCVEIMNHGYTVNFWGVCLSTGKSPKFTGWICQIYDYPNTDSEIANEKGITMKDAWERAYEQVKPHLISRYSITDRDALLISSIIFQEVNVETFGIKNIVGKWLEDNGFDGLCEEDYDCGCEISDLMPCDEPRPGCMAGHKMEDKTGEYDWVIVPTEKNNKSMQSH